MAKRGNVEKNLLKLIYYPKHATPPVGAMGSMMTWVARIRAEATEALREEAVKTEETATPPEPKPPVAVPCQKNTPPCDNAAVPHRRKTGKDRRAPAPTPTFQQICDKAYEMAQEAKVEKNLLKLVYYPGHATPPAGVMGSMMT